MSRYHFNPKTGKTGVCHAEYKCEFASGGHYDSEQEAQSAYEKTQTSKTTSSLSKKKTKRPLTELSKIPKNEPVKRLEYINKNFDDFPKVAKVNGETVPGVATDSQLAQEKREIESELYYGGKLDPYVKDLSQFEITDAEKEGRFVVWIKEDVEHELSTDLARKIKGMPKRKKTNSDRSAYAHACQDYERAQKKLNSESNNKGYLTPTKEYNQAADLYREIRRKTFK